MGTARIIGKWFLQSLYCSPFLYTQQEANFHFFFWEQNKIKHSDCTLKVYYVHMYSRVNIDLHVQVYGSKERFTLLCNAGMYVVRVQILIWFQTFALHKAPFWNQTFNAVWMPWKLFEKQSCLFRHFRLFQTFTRRSHTPGNGIITTVYQEIQCINHSYLYHIFK